MCMKLFYKILIGLTGVGLLGVFFFAGGFFQRNFIAFGAGNYPITSSTDVYNLSSDVVGTHIGTSTVGIAFTGAATSSYISLIGGNKTIANYIWLELPVQRLSPTHHRLNYLPGQTLSLGKARKFC